MSVFRKLFFIAVIAGALAGGLSALLHQVGAVPLILEAEMFEESSAAHGHPGQPHEAVNHEALVSHPEESAGGHVHDPHAWQPENGLERNSFTCAMDVLTGIAFALLLVGAYALSREENITWRKGLFWGLAGFAVFTLAPGLGLPPELPGSAAAPVLDRQMWWAMTALLTAGGLAIFAFHRKPLWMVAAVIMILLPHGIGAPHLAEHHSSAPHELVQQFIAMAMGTQLLFWLCLGAVTGYLYRRMCSSPRFL